MTTIVTRAGKGSPLTHTEVDTNFTNLNTNELEAGAIALGSAATPSISFTGDLNTGIYSPGADTLAFVTNGTERLQLTSTGAVTIANLDAVATTKAQYEESQIRLNAAFSIGTAGVIPFGVGPAIPPGMAFFGIGPDAYNPIHLLSGSFC